ncbi:SdiA-regulated domain-containing protein [Maribacter zhoushanensis]|uniref:SdiA-regulated domain-containing protein n=1 Tax=Maribacter zhoushanensis TaxID=3030012 RepID=UPI0023ED1B0E|nr:SdiA-regulated domain-containing protein [Maribacter zhoushanensis]
MAKVKFWTIAAIFLGMGFLFMNFRDWLPYDSAEKVTYEISGRWELPKELREVSGISWMNENEIAAIQDEDGIIFIYDLKKKKVVNEIEFGNAGDYEGLAIEGNNAYALESDGTITVIKNFQNPNRKVTTYKTKFSEKNNMESLWLDLPGNQLLVIPKDRDIDSDNMKGVYAFSLEDYKLAYKPVLQLDMEDEVLKNFREKKIYKNFRPSDIAIHPQTKEIYMLEGSKPKLLILDENGVAKKGYSLDKKIFPQPEGITFSPQGDLYISSEGKNDGKGTITKLKLLL